MDGFVVWPLQMSQLRVAYPLVREAAPTLDLAGWVRYARRAADPRRSARRGVMIARRASQPHPTGMFCYEKTMDLRYGAALQADHLIVLDLFDPDAVMAALVEALTDLALRLDCSVIRSAVTGGAGDFRASLSAAGHHFESATYRKELAATRAVSSGPRPASSVVQS